MVGKENEEQYSAFTLMAKLDKFPVIAVTDSGKQETIMHGEIIFKLVPEKERPRLYVTRLSLIGEPVRCERGSSGLLSVDLGPTPREIEYARGGGFKIGTELMVHYPLIDEIHGYRRPTEKDQDFFESYVDPSRCELEGRFEVPLEELIASAAEKDDAEPLTQLSLHGTITAAEYQYVSELVFEHAVVVYWLRAWERWIDIQPVFVRSGPGDSSPTGRSFDLMMQAAKCIWRKCCIHFKVREPMYVDNAAFKVLSGEIEASNLKDRVSESDAVEIFVLRVLTRSGTAAVQPGRAGRPTPRS
jgi:hypothetical protein